MTAVASIQVVPLIDRASSGPSLSVPTLCCSLVNAGISTRLMALDPRPDKLIFDDTTFFPCLPVPFAKQLGLSPALKMALHVAAKSADVMHTHSMWKMPNIYPERACRGTECKTVISPRGTMSEWAWKRSKTRKRVIWQMGQKQMVMNADCIHVTSDDELNQVRKVRAGGPVAVIPNGVHCPELPVRSKPTDRARRTVLFLARIHPTKGVDILLEAWRALGKATCDWDLQVAGPRNHAFATKMMQLGHSYGLKNVDFIGEVTGAAKSQTFINADLYVLPTHSENFGISVAEALAHGVPAIVFEGAPWSGLNEKEAGWWIPRSVESLTETLRLAFAVGDVRRAEMGRNGRAWVEEEFDWGVVGLRMAGVYGWLTGGPRPQCVDIG